MSKDPAPFPIFSPQLLRILTGITTVILTTCGVVFYRMTINKAWFEARGDITLQNLSHMLLGAAATILIMFGIEIFARVRTGQMVLSLYMNLLPLIGMASGFGLAWAILGEQPFWWAR